MDFLSRCKVDGICPTMYHIAEATNLDIRVTERILFAMLDLGHVVRFRDRRDNKTRFRLFSTEGPPKKSVRREPPSNNRTPSPRDDSD